LLSLNPSCNPYTMTNAARKHASALCVDKRTSGGEPCWE
jgi:hypothetical protein